VETTISIPRPDNESARLAALHRYRQLDTASEKDFELLTKVAAEICDAPFAQISLVDKDHVAGMASVGMPNKMVPRDEACCSWAILQDGVLEIPDLSRDERTAKLSWIAEAGLRMYVGISLSTREGFHIGTLRVLDRRPRHLNDHQRELLAGLARQVMALLELREHEKLLKEALLREKHLASVDILTGLFNRRVLFERLEGELERSRRYNTPLSLVMIDLDHFKKINDQFGHTAGDAVLRSVGEIVRAGTRASDIAARYGGEELCVVLPQTAIEGAHAYAELLRKQIETLKISYEGKAIPVTASLGVAAFQSDQADVSRIFAAADAALYSAKHGGRNRVALAQPGKFQPVPPAL